MARLYSLRPSSEDNEDGGGGEIFAPASSLAGSRAEEFHVLSPVAAGVPPSNGIFRVGKRRGLTKPPRCRFIDEPLVVPPESHTQTSLERLVSSPLQLESSPKLRSLGEQGMGGTPPSNISLSLMRSRFRRDKQVSESTSLQELRSDTPEHVQPLEAPG